MSWPMMNGSSRLSPAAHAASGEYIAFCMSA